MSEMNPSTAPALLRVDNLRVSFKGENKQYLKRSKEFHLKFRPIYSGVSR